MFDEFLNKANELKANEQPFAFATVVRYEPPISGKSGDKAIIQADGKLWGWIGGGCSQAIAIAEAKKALGDGKPRLVRVSPTADSESQKGITEYNMTCHSGGTLDIYIEPVLPKPQIVIIGRSAVAQTLAKLGKAVNYKITVVAPGADAKNFPEADSIQTQLDLNQIKVTPQTYVVVSTQGEEDEEALEAALKINVPYVAFVASSKKAEVIYQTLKSKGVSDDSLKQIRVPAGLDIKAQLPEEIAVSILAEMIYVKRSSGMPGMVVETESLAAAEVQEATDPICGMLVAISSARYTSNYQGQRFYFCCAGCQQKFEKEPRLYLG